MRALPLVVLLLLTGCSSQSKGDLLPGGTYAGSTASDQPVVLEVGEKVKLNHRLELRPTTRGVFEARLNGRRISLACRVKDNKAVPDNTELRCTLTLKDATHPPVTEVVDLMVL